MSKIMRLLYPLPVVRRYKKGGEGVVGGQISGLDRPLIANGSVQSFISLSFYVKENIFKT